jgi:hypothetical protein
MARRLRGYGVVRAAGLTGFSRYRLRCGSVLAIRRTACGGWPNVRMKARRMRSGSPKPVSAATRSIGSEPLSMRSR